MKAFHFYKNFHAKMKLVAFFAFIAIAVASSHALDSKSDEDWENFKTAYGKKYGSPEEEMHRRMTWEHNAADIIQHNLQADLGLYTFRKGINEYSDLSHSEFLRHFNVIRSNGLRQYQQSNSSSIWSEPLNVKIPDTVDWRTKGAVTPVKNQGNCGSCWAHSAAGAIEGHHKLKTGRLVPLSVQNLVDCSHSEGNLGCIGGQPNYAFEYVIKNNGIDTEESYPYIALDGECLFKEADVGATITGYVDIPSGDEEALKKAVATVGPISVMIDATHKSFHFYHGGIYDELDCSDEMVNHLVLLVGYGTENGIDYWLVKNSFGTSWGIEGYIKMHRNNNNQCGIATQASYPLL